MQKENSLIKGFIHGIPIGIGYLSVSFAFGIMAVQCGLSPLEALLISMTNLTSAGQMAGTPIIASGGSFVELAMTQLIINSRYALMSVALSQKLRSGTGILGRMFIAFANTDEIFAVAMDQKESIGKKYFFGLMSAPWIGWSSGTIIGALAGSALPEIITNSLGVAIYAMLVAVVVPKAKKSLPTALCVMTAILLSCLFKYLPVLSEFSANYGGFVIIICAVAASLLFAVVRPIDPEKEGE